MTIIIRGREKLRSIIRNLFRFEDRTNNKKVVGFLRPSSGSPVVSAVPFLPLVKQTRNPTPNEENPPSVHLVL
ncbi:Uncharacterized protein APZ42_023242 [Daphnia magna]|uniref:Uncharacterized protein n=2 Tax=Daphnia magna TaxID=35525 RepID=A0ABR0AM38_9CRUS|nr:hypothetical protein OUZ56_015064 [Daphnia magna]KZS11944.1 Uncharacterized protein APZ42_023242 [Daphnia magna]